MSHKLQSDYITLIDGENVEDVCLKLLGLARGKRPIEKVIIQNLRVEVQRWVPSDTSAPYGELPVEEYRDIPGLLRDLNLVELDDDAPKLNLEAIEIVARMFLAASGFSKRGLAWVVGSLEAFISWMGVKNTPSHFFNAPIWQYSELPANRILLLCGESTQWNPLDATLGIAAMMSAEIEDAEMPSL